jgi:uncharacterized LabA/DUF88 family protein
MRPPLGGFVLLEKTIMAQDSEQRVGVLVDISNLYHSARVLYGKKVNYKNLLTAAVGERKLIRAIAYGIKTADGMEEKFVEAYKFFRTDRKKGTGMWLSLSMRLNCPVILTW